MLQGLYQPPAPAAMEPVSDDLTASAAVAVSEDELWCRTPHYRNGLTDPSGDIPASAFIEPPWVLRARWAAHRNAPTPDARMVKDEGHMEPSITDVVQAAILAILHRR